ncbi:carbon storage regulator CsrA [Halanaerobium sp. Z-7514]|uniref:Translational regulator CsrA n=1 Tax=Halanaerobium polyolivorans TaxID=2886943 RepID=A0AAW4X086_9FIRM|nr:carbon storage regulator CsrA [Halanaerobium polyolivorans]MCC3145220.1 carbon storage regulator CsrA [Halanaerobium polyolivorans]
MLVLSRKLNEKIIIDGNIEITVLAVENGSVKLGIKAPKEIEILRKELLEEVKAENKAAVQNKRYLKKLEDFYGGSL